MAVRTQRGGNVAFTPVLPTELRINPSAFSVWKDATRKKYEARIREALGLFGTVISSTVTRQQVHVLSASYDGKRLNIAFDVQVEGASGSEWERKLNLLDENSYVKAICGWVPEKGKPMLVMVVYLTFKRNVRADQVRQGDVPIGLALPLNMDEEVLAGRLPLDLTKRPKATGREDALSPDYNQVARRRQCACRVVHIDKVFKGKTQIKVEPIGWRAGMTMVTDKRDVPNILGKDGKPRALRVGDKIMCDLIERPRHIRVNLRPTLVVTTDPVTRESDGDKVKVTELKPGQFRVGGIVVDAYRLLGIKPKKLTAELLTSVAGQRYTKRPNKRSGAWHYLLEAAKQLGTRGAEQFCGEHHFAARQEAVKVLTPIAEQNDKVKKADVEGDTPPPLMAMTAEEAAGDQEAPGVQLVPPTEATPTDEEPTATPRTARPPTPRSPRTTPPRPRPPLPPRETARPRRLPPRRPSS